ncbi:TNC [Branchiostoma lanceolatum]|uniref:TNC protein n=1 Tax=Branchiostoma lanceolatum TaxID=7740 RepID=A0A8K0F0R4_BRALA|nr:TNC [Branchiostoma lanceolatum]
MADCSIEENQGPGIIIEDQAADVNIQNTRVSKNFPYGAQVIRGSPGCTTTFTDSAFTENFGTGLLRDTVRSDIVLSGSNFSSNTHFGLDSINSQMSTLLIQSCTLNSNGLDGVLIQQEASTIALSERSFSIDQSSLSGNLRRGMTVSIMYPPYNSRDHRTLFNVTGSEVSGNLEGAIDISVEGSTSTCYPSLLLDNTVFKTNGGDVVTISGSWSDVGVKNNVFQENRCEQNNVLFFTGQEKNVSCSFNTFQENLCKRLGLFDVTELADVNYIQQTFTENVFADNEYDPPFLYKSDPLRDYCTLEFSGEWRPISVTHNSFQQDVSRFDLCSTVWTHSWEGPTIDAIYNWWGTDDEDVIRQKIFDYNDWNSGAQVTYSPFLDSAGGNPVDAIGNPNPTAQAFGGLLFNDLHIPKGSSPVLMKSDLTILPGATLTLDPGVEVEAAPGVGILNYGHINMVGSDTEPVILGAQSNDNIASTGNLLRVPGHGGLEVFHAGTWKSVCYDYRDWDRYNNNLVIACRQLGRGPPRSVSGTSFGASQKIVVRCDGGEESFQQCNFYDVAPDNHRCGNQARIICEPTPGWGGVRSYGQGETMIEHMLFKDIGQLHNKRSSALSIQSIHVHSVPTLQNIEIDRCFQSRAGVEVFAPSSQITVQHLRASACVAESVVSVIDPSDSVIISNVSVTGGRTLSNSAGIRVESLSKLSLNGLQASGRGSILPLRLMCEGEQQVRVQAGTSLILTNYRPTETTIECTKTFVTEQDHVLRIHFHQSSFYSRNKLQLYGSVQADTVNLLGQLNRPDQSFESVGAMTLVLEVTNGGLADFIAKIEATPEHDSPDTTFSEPTMAIVNTISTNNAYGLKLSGGVGNLTIENSETPSNSYGLDIDQWTGNVAISQFKTGRASTRGIRLSSIQGTATLVNVDALAHSNEAVQFDSSTGGARYFMKNATLRSTNNIGMVVDIRGNSQLHLDDVRFLESKRGGALINGQTSGVQEPGVTVTNSVFNMNKRFAFQISGIASKVDISRNAFERNVCPHAGVLVLSAVAETQNISSNKFTQNNARRAIHSSNLEWSNNIRDSESVIDDNIFSDNFYSYEDTDGNFQHDINIRNTSCTLQFDGYRRAIRFHRNVLDNPSFDHEVCSNIPSRSAEDFVDGRFNWWGTTIENDVRGAIFDFDDHSDHAGVAYLPYLTSSDVTIIPPTNPVSNTDMPLPLLGGRLYRDLHLTRNNSPYIITSDLTILPNVTLTIDPGVEVQAYPCVGLLNLGTLVANGTKQQPITFGPSSNTTTHVSPVKSSLFRLTDGIYPWEGELEVFHEGRWYNVCSGYFNNEEMEVLCRDFGYGPQLDTHSYSLSRDVDSVRISSHSYFDCQGDEEKLIHCYKRESVFSRQQCSSGYFVRCSPISTHSTLLDTTCSSHAWGGLRMASDESFVLNHVQISGSGTLHSKTASGLSIEKVGGRVSNVLIKNCTGSGLEIFGPGSETSVINSEIRQCQADTGIVIYGTQGDVHVSRARVIDNSFVTGGVSLFPWEAYVNRENFENVIGICDSEEDLFLTAGAYFVYETKKTGNSQCVKHIHAGIGQDIHLRVIVARFKPYSSKLRVYSDKNQQQFLGEVNYRDPQHNMVFHSTDVISLNVQLSSNRDDEDVYLELQIARSSAPARRTITDSVFSNNNGTVVNITTLSETEVAISRTSLTANTPRNGEDLQATIFLNTSDIHCTIHNNYFLDNSIKGLVGRNLGSSALALVHNTFDTNHGQGSVDLTNDGTGDCQALIVGNDFVSNDASSDFSIIALGKTTGTVKKNRFEHNTALYVVDWQVRENNRQSQIFSHNRLEHNSGQRPGYKHTVAMSGPDVHLHQNVLINPANDAELIALNTWSSAHVDATNNWWGFNQSAVIAERIRDSRDRPELPDVLFEPFLQEDPEKGVCRYPWFQDDEEQLGYCYLYKGAARTLIDAWDSCKEQYAQVVMKASDKELHFLSATLQREMDDVKSALEPEPFWADQELSSAEQACWVYRQNAGVSDVLTAQCDSRYPFFCKLPVARGCLNDCSRNGACLETTCYCDRGWSGSDCSQPNCQDLDDCGEFGVCVGPNVCRCRNGWQGRGCTVSYCSRFDTCKSCVQSVGCGWCDQTQSCESGLYGGPDVIPCPTWFYHNCFTVGNKGLCSDDIEVVDCEYRQCNSSLSTTTVESCLRCQDVEGCFKDTEDGYCKVWDQSRCPKGFVYPLYNDTTRIEKVLTGHNVKYVPSDGAPLYHCQVRFSSWGATLFIQEGELDVQLGQVLSSPQAGGVLHKVEQVVAEGAYTLVAAHPATLEDMFNYADFSQRVRLEPVVDFSTMEQEPPLSVIQNVMRGNGTFQGDNTHVIDPDVTVYKCVGPSGSLRLVVHESDPNLPDITVGDVIVGNRSNGMLEFVTSLSNTAFGTVIQTNLADCSGGLYSILERFPTVSGQDVPPPLSCSGGTTGETGLLITEARDLLLQQGRVVVGRKTGRFAAKVLSKRVATGSGFIVMDVEPITIDASQRSSGVENSAMRWDIAGEDVVMTSSFQLTASVNVSFTADIGLSNTLSTVGYRRRTLEKSEVQFIGGKVEIELAGEAVTFRGFMRAYTGSLSLQTNKEKVLVCIMDDVCIPGEKWASVSMEYALHASSAGSMKMASTVTKPDIDASAGRSPQDGSQWFQFDQNEEASSSRITIASYEGEALKSDKFVVMEMMATPTFYLDLPVRDEYQVDTPTSGLQQLFGHIEEDIFPYRMTASVEAKALLRTSTETCSQECPHADRPQRVGVTSQLEHLKGRLDVDLTTVVHSQEKVWRDGTWMDSDLYCAAQTTNITTCDKVCYCGGDPSLAHPVDTSVCQCPCTCSDGTVSFKHPDIPGGECNCERCPDGSMKVPDEEGRLRCPCLCADNSTREMIPGGGGKCDCSCPCADGSSDVIAADGSCPCRCTCRNCQESVLGPHGCLCTDSCPDCENGEEPVWVGCSCKCPQKTECGAPPTCVVGRIGVDCRQPDCRPCQDCSGNGHCRSSADSCQSSCVCHSQWFGDCCHLRRPRPVGGDPHLQTLDGRAFDYHGIGEFWDCKSPENDFGVQTRMFGFRGASLIGAAAVKTGHSVVTITTPEHATGNSLPSLRIDGSLQTISSGQTYALNNGTVHLLVEIPSTAVSQSGEVKLFSFTFESGASVAFDIRFSPKMGRQYLNVIFSPTAGFKEKTQGLCGYMDDDEDNDFTGPDGTLHGDAPSFAESWRIITTHHGSGLLGSWSWDSSNFHPDDVAEETCAQLGLSGVLLEECIFDVVITNDTTFSQQEVFKLGCPSQCSGRGRCVNNTCECMPGWSGPDCDVGNCTDCSAEHGKCVLGFCQCEPGWEGTSCSQRATCHAVNNCTDEQHGLCVKTNICACVPGYIGTDCSEIPTCYKTDNCTSRGVCVDHDTCLCDKDYTGDKCDKFSCRNLDTCTGHGRCVDIDVCACDWGWTGSSCAVPDCPLVNHCSRHGDCVAPDLCRCYPGYDGKDCSLVQTCPELNNCSSNGICVRNESSGNHTCRCFNGYDKDDCSRPDCSGRNDCSGRGVCVEPMLCECDKGYGGVNCTEFSCEKNNYCSGHGDCTNYDVCTCHTSWSGEACTIPDCTAVSNCSSRGTCLAPDTCACYPGYEGHGCELESAPNVHRPNFTQDIYRIQVVENTPVGTVVATVRAADNDTGINGEVKYRAVELTNTTALTLVPGTADIVTTMELDFEAIGGKEFELIVEAIDGGAPTLTGTATVVMTVIDDNDNIPALNIAEESEVHVVLSAPIGHEVITINASDHDVSASFSNVTFSLASANDFFVIDEMNGRIQVQRALQIGTYPLEVVASDGGFPAKARRATVRAVVSRISANTPPVCQPQNGPAHLNADISKPGDVVTTVSALDHDVGPAGDLGYSISDRKGNLSSEFQVDSTTGNILLATTLNHSSVNISFVSLTVRATDLGTPSLDCDLRVNIVITKDQSPPVNVTFPPEWFTTQMDDSLLTTTVQGLNTTAQGLNTTGQGLNTTGQGLNTTGQDLNTTGQDLNTTGQDQIGTAVETNEGVTSPSTIGAIPAQLTNWYQRPEYIGAIAGGIMGVLLSVSVLIYVIKRRNLRAKVLPEEEKEEEPRPKTPNRKERSPQAWVTPGPAPTSTVYNNRAFRAYPNEAVLT